MYSKKKSHQTRRPGMQASGLGLAWETKRRKTITLKGLLSYRSFTAHDGTTGWKDQMDQEYLNWQPWIYTEDESKKAEARKVELPTIDVAHFYWTPKWSKKEDKKLVFPIVIKRTLDKKKFEEKIHFETNRKNEIKKFEAKFFFLNIVIS